MTKKVWSGNEGLFINTKVSGIPVTMLVDTGASITILKTDYLHCLPRTVTEQLEMVTTYLVSATGDRIPFQGKCKVHFEIDNRHVEHEVWFADIQNEGIIGFDFLSKHRCNISLETFELITGKYIILLQTSVSGSNFCRVLIHESTTIPPNTEVVNIETETHQISTCSAKNDSGPSDLPPHLEKLFENSCQELDHKQQQKLKELLCNYANIFSKSPTDIGRTNLVKHKIETGNHKPVRQPPRRIPFSKRKEVQKEIDDMKSMGVIEPSESPWCSPIVLVRKKDGNLRFCIDFRKTNDLTVKDSHPLPRIDDTLETLSNASWFSTLDMRKGYWQVEVDEKDRPKTAFATGNGGLYQWAVLPFGLCNAPSTFERLMEKVLSGLTTDYVWYIWMTS